MDKQVEESEVLVVEDLMKILNIGKNLAYALIKQKGFPVIRIKGVYRIPKKSFEQWLYKEA
jgi:predicted DNA-binding transcriptional regulator AlpA